MNNSISDLDRLDVYARSAKAREVFISKSINREEMRRLLEKLSEEWAEYWIIEKGKDSLGEEDNAELDRYQGCLVAAIRELDSGGFSELEDDDIFAYLETIMLETIDARKSN
jgi:hypothetical protein